MRPPGGAGGVVGVVGGSGGRRRRRAPRQAVAHVRARSLGGWGAAPPRHRTQFTRTAPTHTACAPSLPLFPPPAPSRVSAGVAGCWRLAVWVCAAPRAAAPALGCSPSPSLSLAGGASGEGGAPCGAALAREGEAAGVQTYIEERGWRPTAQGRRTAPPPPLPRRRPMPTARRRPPSRPTLDRKSARRGGARRGAARRGEASAQGRSSSERLVIYI